MRHRFPGFLADWARFDGPAGTQMVDPLDPGAWSTGLEVATTPTPVGPSRKPTPATTSVGSAVEPPSARLLGADPAGVCFGANMTTMTLASAAPSGSRFVPVTGWSALALIMTRNVSPWRIAAHRARAPNRCWHLSTQSTGELDPGRCHLAHRRADALGHASRCLEPDRDRTRPSRRSSMPRMGPGPCFRRRRRARHRIGASTLRRMGATRSRRRRTSGTARMPGCCGARPDLLD